MSTLSPGTSAVVGALMETPPTPGGGTPAAADSALGRFRQRHADRMRAEEDVFVDLLGDDLVARLKKPSDVAAAKRIMRTVLNLTSESAALDVTEDEMADVIAFATVDLHIREKGKLEPMVELDQNGAPIGAPLTFDARLLAMPEITAPRDVVLVTFTTGDPPALDFMALLIAASNIAMMLTTGQARRREVAADVVGEASAPRG